MEYSNLDLTSPKQIKEILENFGFRFSKSLGQNFIIDRNIIDKIIDLSNITKDYGIIEIGPGFGVLTRELCKKAGKVVSIEIDKSIYPVLEQTLGDFDNFTLIKNDVLKVDLLKTIDEYFAGMPVKIVANLPYYITTPIIMHILESKLPVEEIVVMVQKEVAERMSASYGSKVYGALSVAVQYHSEVNTLVTVSKNSFMPAPKVDSQVVSLRLRKCGDLVEHDEAIFFKVVKAAFGMRRKTILNSLSGGNLGLNKQEIQSLLDKLGIAENLRAEVLDIKEFAKIAKAVGGLYEKSIL